MQHYYGFFGPEDLSVLGRIFDTAVTALPASIRTPENRTAIARLVLRRAGAGEAQSASLMSLMDVISPAA
ncbi:hypothetical protein QMZ05_29400 [Bradyrhizobium sp. INPA03-11B]|uniref:hypothetical protein n=1 Tax=Bradyrhizobium sp. INPA03-11B TaxID=418598 RepID=UPI00338D72E0